MRVLRTQSGFSLIELIIVVIILGVIAAIAVPRLSNAASNSRYNAAHQGFRNIAVAMDTYYMDNLSYPPNTHVGVFPTEMDGYLHPTAFTKPSPIGGGWDWNGPGSGINTYGTNLSIHRTTVAERIQMERRFDDRNSGTGVYRIQSHYLIWPMEN